MTLHDALTKIDKHLNKKIDNALSKEVFAKVRDAEVSAIEKEVYEVYEVYNPQGYRRRMASGGLSDPKNIVIEGGAATGGRLSVVNVTPSNPGGCKNRKFVTTDKDLPSLVEYGDGYQGYHYDFASDGAYMGPRPFTETAAENLKKTGAHVKALKDGLRRQGIKVK